MNRHLFAGEDVAVLTKPLSTVTGLVFLMCGGISLGLAQGPSDGQKPPAAQEEPAKIDKATDDKPKCVTSNTAWREKGKSITFEIELLNTCDMRLKCTIDASVLGARGPAQGHGTVVLAAAPKGQTTRNVYAMKVKSAGGMANISHTCKAI